MTTDSAEVRPYSVNVRVLHGGDFDSSIRLHNYVDRGLSPSEIESLSSRSDIKKVTLASMLLEFPLLLIALMALAVWGIVQWADGSVAGGAAWAAAVVPVAAAIVWSYITKMRITNRLTLLKDELIEAGRLANPHVRRSDLRRIDAALTALQATEGTAFDGLARKAVIAVLDQDINIPSQKTVAIADSEASDPDTEVVRARVRAQRALHSADIAKAESLIFELEQFAAEKKSGKQVTAG